MIKSTFKYFYSFRVIRSKSDSVCQLFVLEKQLNFYNKLPRLIKNLRWNDQEFDFNCWDFRKTKFARLEWGPPKKEYKYLKDLRFTYKIWGKDLIIIKIQPVSFDLQLFIAPGKGNRAKEIIQETLKMKFESELNEMINGAVSANEVRSRIIE